MGKRNVGVAYAAAWRGDHTTLLREWRREWEANGRPEHDCGTEEVYLPGRNACGVCGSDYVGLDDTHGATA
jgi:hypothetical protein